MPAFQRLVNRDTSLVWTSKVPNAAQVKIAQTLVKILERVKISCKIWETDTTPSIHTVVRELWNIKGCLEEYIDSEADQYISDYALKLRDLIENRFPDCGTNERINAVSHFLDPEFKGLILNEFPGAMFVAKSEVIRIASKYETVDCDVPETEAAESVDLEVVVASDLSLTPAQKLLKRRKLSNEGSVVQAAAPSISRIQMEINTYENLSTEDDFKDILLWWKEREKLLPLLSKVAREFLAQPASSGTSERSV